MLKSTMLLFLFLVLPGRVVAQDQLPTELRARAALKQTVAELVRIRSAWVALPNGDLRRLGGRLAAEWFAAGEMVGNFMMGYIVALLDRGVPVLGTDCGSINAVDLGEAAIEIMVAAEDRWREKWTDVLRGWLRTGLLADPEFRSMVCRSGG